MNYSPRKMKENLENNNFKFKKNFGQNFIIDENIVNSIVNKAQIKENSLVIEIGPGAGSLTGKLCQVAKYVLCYEIDESIENILNENLNCYNNYEVIFDDFLKRNVEEDLKKYNYDNLYVVANLPYYITTPIVVKLVEENIDVSKIVVMVQKEVGDRFKAVPGTKDYSSLSVFLSYYFKTSKLLDVSRNVFIPKPNVDSIVVALEKKMELKHLENKELFFKLVKDSFTQKRKTLRNNLKDYDLENIKLTLEKYNLDLSVRAEQLSLDIFIEISNNLSK
ncbi:MAG: 16S rRNA (adenine(1518)-N(6)/adenine(1519)-N(6))-dimethyltransferase RsmA [Mycoplasmatota bacterium]